VNGLGDSPTDGGSITEQSQVVGTANLARWIELIALFILAPGLLALALHLGWARPSWLFPSIWILALLCAAILWRDPTFPARNASLGTQAFKLLGLIVVLILIAIVLFVTLQNRWRLLGVPLLILTGFVMLDGWFNRREVWNLPAAKRDLPRILGIFVPSAVIVGLTLWRYEPERLFILARERPEILAIITLFYPLLSVWPQELAFRTFFFHRYAPLFVRKGHGPETPRRPALLIFANTLIFAWAHIVMLNTLALMMCILGGALFAYTYHRTRSLAAVWLEHTLHGVWIFAVGWGWYFFAGARLASGQ
jgi:uncharacterized protein